MSSEEVDLRIESFDRFLSRIVSLIPAHLYEHTLSEDAMHSSTTDEGSSKYYKHKKQPLAADERKSKSKRKRAEVYGASEENASETADATATSINANPIGAVDCPESEPTISCNLEELRLKLQEKLINYRLKRTSTKASRPSEAKGGDRIKSKGDTTKPSKRKPTPPAPAASGTGGVSVDSKAKKSPGKGSGSGLGLSEELRSVQQDLQFSNMVLPPPVSQSAPTAGSGSGAPATGNKTQRLQRLLAETEKKRKRLQELSKAETPQDSKQLKSILWNDAIKAAAGEKSLVTGSKESELKIKKALRKKQKAKEKSAVEWQQRLEAVEEGKQAKAQRRENNLLSRQGKGGAAPAADGDAKSKTHASGGDSSGGGGGGRKKPRTEPTKSPKAAASASQPAATQRRPGFEGRFKTGEFLNQRKGGPA